VKHISTQKNLRSLTGLGNLCTSAAYNQGRLTLFCWHHFVRPTITGSLQ